MSDETPFIYMPFAQVPTRAVFDRRLSKSDWRVLTYLAALSVNSKKRAWMSQQKLADRIGVDVSTVKRAVKWLRTFGYIKVESNGRKGKGRRNRYYILHDPQGYSDDHGMWDPNGERAPFDGPLSGTPRHHKPANGGTHAPINGGRDAPQEIEDRDRNSLRDNPYGREDKLRASPKESSKQEPKSVAKGKDPVAPVTAYLDKHRPHRRRSGQKSPPPTPEEDVRG